MIAQQEFLILIIIIWLKPNKIVVVLELEQNISVNELFIIVFVNIVAVI